MKRNYAVAASWTIGGVVVAIAACAGRVVELGGGDGLDVTNGTIAEGAFPNDASSISKSDGGGTNVCFTPGPLQAVVTLSDLGGQWVTGCDPGGSPLPLIAAGADASIPADTVGFEIDPSTHLFYALVAVDGGFARATGPGSAWYADDPYPGCTMPDGWPEEFLSIYGIAQIDGSSDGEYLLGMTVLYHPPTEDVLASLTLASCAGEEPFYAVTLVPPAAILGK
jgi:hypothetical protein